MRLLIVDDEEHVIEGIKFLVDWEEYGIDEVLECSQSEKAIEMVKEYKPDIVFTDMNMPNVHGTELVELITSFDPGIKVIVISGYTDFNYIQHTLRHGGLDYITKPINEEQLNQALAKAIERIEEEKRAAVSKKRLRRLSPIYLNQLLQDSLDSGTLSEESGARLSDEFQLERGMEIRIITVDFEGVQKVLGDQFSNDKKLLFFSIRNIYEEVMTELNIKGYVFMEPDPDGFLKILLWDSFLSRRCWSRNAIKS